MGFKKNVQGPIQKPFLSISENETGKLHIETEMSE